MGYTVGTLYHVFGTLDRLKFEINTITFRQWVDLLEQRLAESEGGRLDALVEGYFDFAIANRHLWSAIWAHNMPEGEPLPQAAARNRARLTGLVVDEIAAALPEERRPAADRLARSLIATGHGHCEYSLSGAFALMGVTDPVQLAKE